MVRRLLIGLEGLDPLLLIKHDPKSLVQTLSTFNLQSPTTLNPEHEYVVFSLSLVGFFITKSNFLTDKSSFPSLIKKSLGCEPT